MNEPTTLWAEEPLPQRSLVGPFAVVVVFVLVCSAYANLSFLVTDREDFRFFPPFRPGVDRNMNDHLGAEYYSIARALAAGRGFSDPFRAETGPTAWMAPMLVWILAALHWLAEGHTPTVTAMVVALQNLTLIGAGVLAIVLARQTTGRVWPATIFFVGAAVYYFRHCFQFTHDCWLVLLALNLLVAGLVWWRPFASWRRAFVWGLFGGFCALCSPIVGFTWGVLSVGLGLSRRQRWRVGVALLAAGLAVAPWIVRNYVMFGRFIPVKSNAAFELYQSQCLQAGGVLRHPIFASHPYAWDNEERWEYGRVGEMAYLDEKKKLFMESVRDNPLDFVERMANRFFAATLEYTPFNAEEEARRPWLLLVRQVVFPLPFLALVVLLLSSFVRPLTPAHWIVSGVYLCYLLPYVVISYYDRYKFPLFGTEVLLVTWAVDRVVRLLDAGEESVEEVIE